MPCAVDRVRRWGEARWGDGQIECGASGAPKVHFTRQPTATPWETVHSKRVDLQGRPKTDAILWNPEGRFGCTRGRILFGYDRTIALPRAVSKTLLEMRSTDFSGGYFRFWIALALQWAKEEIQHEIDDPPFAGLNFSGDSHARLQRNGLAINLNSAVWRE